MDKSSQVFEFLRVLSIAGSDSGGGAGIQADIKTFSALGCYAMTAITAVTAQNSLGVKAIQGISPNLLRDQIDTVLEDIGAHAVKVGMLHSSDIVRTVAQAIDRHQLKNVVFDPVMVATSGAALIDRSAISVLVTELFSRSLLVTPNLDEASLLVGRPLCSESEMEEAARDILRMGANAVLLKGGHLPGNLVSDLLLIKGDEPHWMRATRIDTVNTHGTGCTLSSAVAAYLASGSSLRQSVESARAYVRAALEASAMVRTGAGSGSLNHGYSPLAMQLKPLP